MPATTRHAYLSAQDARLEDLQQIVNQRTDPRSCPHAARTIRNHQRGAALRLRLAAGTTARQR